MSRRPPAPIVRDSVALAEWLLSHCGASTHALDQRLCAHALALAEAIALAWKERRREEHLERADELVIALRVSLRLAESTGRFTPTQALFALHATQQIARQLSGWLQALGAV